MIRPGAAPSVPDKKEVDSFLATGELPKAK